MLLLEAWKLDAEVRAGMPLLPPSEPPQKARQSAAVLKRVPFSSSTKYMVTVVAAPNGRARVLCTGAAEVVIKLCTRTLNADGKVPSVRARCV